MTAPAGWTLLAAILTLAIFSFLYRDNPLYKLAEHLFVGIGTGYWFAVEWRNVIVPNFWEKFRGGETSLAIPLLLGLLLFTRFLPRVSWLSRWSMGIMVGAFSGLAVIGFLQSELLAQLEASVVSLRTGDLAADLNNLLLVVGVLASLLYFFFSLEHRGAVGAAARVGIWFLMVSFGASYGFTVMARISLLIGRLQFLLSDVPRAFGLPSVG